MSSRRQTVACSYVIVYTSSPIIVRFRAAIWKVRRYKSIIYDCQANFNFLPPSLIVDMRRAKFLCKIFTMENYDYSIIMKQAKTDYASLCHTYGVPYSQGYLPGYPQILNMINSKNFWPRIRLWFAVNIALCVELCLTRYAYLLSFYFGAAYYVRIKLNI